MDRMHYHDPQVTVTAVAIETDGRHIPLAELTEVWHRRGGRSWRRVAGRATLGLAIGVPVALALAAVAVAVALGLSGMAMAVAVGAALVVGLVTVPLADLLLEHLDRAYARGAREWEIWGRWRGAEVLLLRTRDRQRFGQVYRAIERAAER